MLSKLNPSECTVFIPELSNRHYLYMYKSVRYNISENISDEKIVRKTRVYFLDCGLTILCYLFDAFRLRLIEKVW